MTATVYFKRGRKRAAMAPWRSNVESLLASLVPHHLIIDSYTTGRRTMINNAFPVRENSTHTISFSENVVN
jgi:hypothetical protein